ncbi:MAG TPA: HAMP domain-containing sensor histidine kinase [Candidatus Limiplasma sp.]|nr:HAMP domain-containing sensor histidine kinase [Candidatus Limiplasma sp.]HRX08450.1 HAMP domain-containing sensor histidine kinase [Candidatus Limiplasma sp.]
MRNRIAQKLLLYFIIPLGIFAVMSGVLFQTLFTRNMTEETQRELTARAVALADTLSGAVSGETAGNGTSPGMGMGKGSSNAASMGMNTGLSAYLPALGLLDVDVWVLDADLNFLTTGRRMMGIVYQDLPEDADHVVDQVFAGETVVSRGFSDLLGAPTITVGAPIYKDTEIYGALLMHDAVSGIHAVTQQGTTVLIYSGAIALCIAVLLAIWLSYAFGRPLNQMKNTALTLAGGEYSAKTGVRRADEIGKLAQAMDVLSDRLSEARRQKEQQEQLRMEFLSNVSHELRTPATVLRGSLEALRDGVVTDPAQVKAYHEQMLRETLGLQRLTNDLLELSKLQNPDFEIERSDVVLQDVLSDALHAADLMAQKKTIAIKREMPEDAVTVQGDYGRLRQMFLIVLDNAVKFSGENSRIEVALTQTRVTVRDFGAGIAPDLLPYIFDRFRKTPSEENRQGSGLGLAIARQIAVRHGMEIKAESTPGEGTTFTFTI